MTPGRRSILAAAALSLPAQAQAQAQAQGQAQPQPPAETLRRVAALRLGANLERWYPIARDNRPRRLGPGWWREFRAAGFDHVRLFLPGVADTGAGTEVPALFQQAVEDATASGLVVLLGLADMFYETAPWSAADWAALEQRAGYFAPRAGPDRVVLAPLNEPAFTTAAGWQPQRDRMLALLRRAAPRHLLMWGGHEWCSARSLLQAAPPGDAATIAEVHDYEGGDAAAVRARFAALAAWRDRRRRQVLVTELGGAKGHETDRPAWLADLRTSLPVLRELRLPATLWSYSHGGWWRMQPQDAPAPHPDLGAVLRG